MLFDETVVESIAGSMPVWAAVLMVFISYLGSIYLILPSTIIVYFRKTSWQTGTWLGAILGGYGTFTAIKPFFEIPRPIAKNVSTPLAGLALPLGFEQLHRFAVELTTPSFPSGHATAMTVFLGLFVTDLDIGTFRRRLTLAIIWIGSVGFSRVALGTHYIGDILGGILIGIVFLWLVFKLRKKIAIEKWWVLDPGEGILLLAIMPALATIVGGRIIDGIVLLMGITITFIAHRSLDIRNLDFQELKNKIGR